MSTAALHSVPHQSRTLATNSSVANLPPGRPCTSGMTQAREGYFAPSPVSNSSSPAWRSSRRPNSVSGMPANNYSQTRSIVNTPSPSTSNRVQHLSLSPTGIPVEQIVMSPGDTLRGVPPVISPRTSSNRASHNNSSLVERPSSRKNGPGGVQSPQEKTNVEAYHCSRDKLTSMHGTSHSRRGNEDRTTTSTSRRAQSMLGEMNPDQNPQNHDKNISSATSPSTSRRKNGKPTDSLLGDLIDTNSLTGPSREASEVLNRIVISQPEVDIEREPERMAEVVPAPQGTPVSVAGDNSNKTRSTRSRHNYANNPTKREKNIKFGEYYLGGTLGEGEFGKVKMGWKQEGGVQVAIKLIRRDSVGTNPSRLTKIYREIAILREISHPNIVRLHEMVETEKQIGIILEYASGGELFDYILNHRYLKDNAARRLFAQLVSGVGYLHKKGIVHRDLKLENLLLDRNRNIIITDFGFANTFNADDELSEEIEYNLSNKDFVKKAELDKVLSDGHRRGDLMQTSCGSPCYAAPELVVSDSLYTGRKVDVWSCGVILYAMLAGYLPFDDDPANPEGDNINLLYKYIVSTPLTFPEYVSPHARDLLRRILVPDPRKRADLFEVARHSWLAEYAHVVSFITCTATTTHEVSSEVVRTNECQDVPILSRSASVREPVKSQKSLMADSDLPRKNGKMDQELHESHKASKDNKRRTVQVEYVPPRSETQRGSHSASQASSKKRVRAGSQGSALYGASSSQSKPTSSDVKRDQSRVRSPNAKRKSISTQIPIRREPQSSNIDVSHHSSHPHPPVSLARPNTGGSSTPTAAGSRPVSMHLTSRSSYSKPLAPTLAGTNVQGQMTQPKGGKTPQLNVSEAESISGCESVAGRISNRSGQVWADSDGTNKTKNDLKGSKGHRRSNTIGGFFSRTNSVFGGGIKRGHEEKLVKKYPPVSRSAITGSKEELSRQSIDSRRSVSFGFAKKRSGSISNSQAPMLPEKPRRFSLLPPAFSLRAIGIAKDSRPQEANQSSKYVGEGDEYIEPAKSAPLRPEKQLSTTGNMPQNTVTEGQILDSTTENPKSKKPPNDTNANQNPPNQSPAQLSTSSPFAFRQGPTIESESSIMEAINVHRCQVSEPQQSVSSQPSQKSANGRGLLQKNNRRFADAYEQELGNGFGTTHSDHAGSSGAARKVMDFFRRRGRDRGL